MAAPSTRRWVRLLVKTIECVKAERPLMEMMKLDEFMVRGRLVGMPRLLTPAEWRVVEKALKELFARLTRWEKHVAFGRITGQPYVDYLAASYGHDIPREPYVDYRTTFTFATADDRRLTNEFFEEIFQLRTSQRIPDECNTSEPAHVHGSGSSDAAATAAMDKK